MSDPDIRVEIVRSRTARSRPYRYIIRKYFANGFTLLSNGGPYELEATAREAGEKRASELRDLDHLERATFPGGW